jgi:uncharacterized membrane protein YqjE
MNPEGHERARRLIDARLIEGIAAPESEWLEAHLVECSACQARSSADERALQALRSNTLRVSPTLVSATQARVRWRSSELRENQARLRTLWFSCGLSWLVGAVTAPLLWQTIAWLGRRFEVSPAIGIMAFATCWLAPAAVVGAVMAWRHSHAASAGNGPEAWER